MGDTKNRRIVEMGCTKNKRRIVEMGEAAQGLDVGVTEGMVERSYICISKGVFRPLVGSVEITSELWTGFVLLTWTCGNPAGVLSPVFLKYMHDVEPQP